MSALPVAPQGDILIVEQAATVGGIIVSTARQLRLPGGAFGYQHPCSAIAAGAAHFQRFDRVFE